jgi:hypothetical protein
MKFFNKLFLNVKNSYAQDMSSKFNAKQSKTNQVLFSMM